MFLEQRITPFIRQVSKDGRCPPGEAALLGEEVKGGGGGELLLSVGMASGHSPC